MSSVTVIPTAFILLMLTLPLPAASAEAVVKTVPEAPFQGDVFIIEVQARAVPSGEFDGKRINFYPLSSGRYYAICAVRIDMEPGAETIYIRTGEKTHEHIFRILNKDFPVTRITLPEKKVFLSDQDSSRVAEEYARISNLWSRVSRPFWRSNFRPPREAAVTSSFGVVRIINDKKKSYHRGTDYRGREGEQVSAINSGIAVLVSERFYGGKTVMVDHGGGIFSIYMHLSAFRVKKGQVVRKGDVVGLVGSSGRVTGPHLHLSVKVQGMSINPESLFRLSLPLTKDQSSVNRAD